VLKDSVSPAPGFFEQVVGMKKDEEKEFTLPFPEDYPNANVAGKEAKFKVKVSEIKIEKLPELNDEFAPVVSAEFKNLADLREEVVKGLRSQADESIRQDYEERVINAAVKGARIEYPPVVVDYEIRRIVQEQERQLNASNRSMDDYLKNIGKTEQQLVDDLRPIAVRNVEASLLLSKIADAENIEVTEEDIDNGIKNMCKNVPEEQQEAFFNMLNTPQTRQSLSSSLRTRKVIERLAEIAKTEDYKPKTPETPVAEETTEAAPAAAEEPPAAADPEKEVKEETE
jgi:trigger factor